MNREIPLYTLDGVTGATVSTYPFTTEDGLGLGLLRFCRRATGPVVLLVHGLTLSSDMFIMPEHRNLVSFLLDNGYTDVWSLDLRMSNRYPYNLAMHRYTLDDVAQYDHPAALRTLRGHIGDRPLHVITHCLGATSFLMSLFGGTVDGVASVIANSVGLTPRVPALSMVKLPIFPFLVEYGAGLPYVNPGWGDDPRLTLGWLTAKAISLVHPECDSPACHLLSFLWGAGWPGMYVHDNILPVTHERIGDLCQGSGVNYYRHIQKMVRAGRAVKYDPANPGHAGLPDDYLANAGAVSTPILLTTGDHNRVFSDSNQVFHERLEEVAPGRHELRVLPNYGHLDPFIGCHADLDVFGYLLDFLNRQGE